MFDFSGLMEYVGELESVYSEFVSFTKDNQVIGGMIGVWLLSVVTYFLRSIPNKISYYIDRYLTVSVTLNNKHESFHDFLIWYGKNKNINTNRTLRVDNGTYGHDNTTISVGFGNHYFRHGGRFFKMTRFIQSADGGDHIKEEISIKTIGFTQKPIINLIKSTIPKKKHKKYLYLFGKEGWARHGELPKRSWESVILRKGLKEEILAAIKEFEADKEWYVAMAVSARIVRDPGSGWPPGPGWFYAQSRSPSHGSQWNNHLNTVCRFWMAVFRTREASAPANR